MDGVNIFMVITIALSEIKHVKWLFLTLTRHKTVSISILYYIKNAKLVPDKFLWTF